MSDFIDLEQHQLRWPQYQYKLFSPSIFFAAHREARYYVFRFWHLNLLRATKRKGAELEKFTQDTNHVSLACGFKMLSRLGSLGLLYVPCFLCDLRPGLKPTRKFILTNQVFVSCGIVLGVFLVHHIYVPILSALMQHSMPESSKLIRVLLKITIQTYVTFGIITTLYLISKRDFLYNFVLHQCASISLPADFQNYQATQLYLRNSLLNLLSEPLFLFATILEVFKQPDFLPNLTWFQFQLVKQAVLWSSLLLVNLVNALHNMIPIYTQFLIAMCEGYAHELIDKQMARIKSLSDCGDDCAHFESRAELVALLSKESLNYLEEYSCTTICRDWPAIPADLELGDFSVSASASAASDDDHDDHDDYQHHHHHHNHAGDDVDDEIANERQQQRQWRNTEQQDRDRSLIVGSRIFLYKNLTKGLVELKELIRSWESQFGIFHLLCTSFTGLMVAEWVVIGRAENQVSVLHAQQFANAPLFYRAMFSLLNYTVLNYVVFQKCDMLPRRMEKIRQKLFKLNLDLVEPGEGMGRRKRGNRRPALTLATQQEIELVWSLFDQADRVIKEVNFRFTGKTLYSKRCLITIFTREASLILLYMQVIDIYSTV